MSNLELIARLRAAADQLSSAMMWEAANKLEQFSKIEEAKSAAPVTINITGNLANINEVIELIHSEFSKFRVNPLEWIDITDADCLTEAYAFGYRYWIIKTGQYFCLFVNGLNFGGFSDIESAKIGAQHHLENQIKSWIKTGGT